MCVCMSTCVYGGGEIYSLGNTGAHTMQIERHSLDLLIHLLVD